MKKTKLFTLGLATLMAFGLTGCSKEPQDALERIKEQGYITVGTSPDYAPNEFYINKDGKKELVGNDIALAQAIADEIGVRLEIQESDFNTVIVNAQTGTIDLGLSGFAWTQTRDDAVDFSESYARDSDTSSFQGVLVRTEDVAKFPNKEAFRESGATIGAQSASIQYEMALTIADEKNIVQIAGTADNALQLVTGDIDAFVCTSPQALAYVKQFDGKITLLPKETFNMDPEGKYNRTGAIFSKDPAFDSLQEVVNKVIKKAKEKNEDGKSQLDIWYEEAVALSPYDITEELFGN